ncbi:hypothetical protein, partial [Campylobacter fetus]|uniref:hypothetical protein n=1 Tax=Campylobacter fetus TaxID=196 RepID=UPI001F1CCDD7
MTRFNTNLVISKQKGSNLIRRSLYSFNTNLVISKRGFYNKCSSRYEVSTQILSLANKRNEPKGWKSFF